MWRAGLQKITQLLETPAAQACLLPMRTGTSDQIRARMAARLLESERTTHTKGDRDKAEVVRTKTRIGAPIRPLMQGWVRAGRTAKVLASAAAFGAVSLAFIHVGKNRDADATVPALALTFAALAGGGALRAARYQHVAESLLHNEGHMAPREYRYLLQAAVNHVVSPTPPRQPGPRAEVLPLTRKAPKQTPEA